MARDLFADAYLKIAREDLALGETFWVSYPARSRTAREKPPSRPATSLGFLRTTTMRRAARMAIVGVRPRQY